MKVPHGCAGLGFAMAKRIIELHRGRIWVESRLGQRSAFHFEPVRIEQRGGLS
jgi:two-component system, chemotaxis family, sensor kinase Cph1